MSTRETSLRTTGVVVRAPSPAMRGLLGVFSVLTALAVLALFVLAERTDDLFAWTINPPLTAAFLGAGYASGCVLVALSIRSRVWAQARTAVVTIFAFVVLTLVATLLHTDKFHFHRVGVAGAAAWFWLGVYVLVPVAMAVLLVHQERLPGQDPPKTRPIPAWLSAALLAEGAVLAVVGVLLFVVPSTADTLWPWTLTPLTSRAVGAWLISYGVAAAFSARGADLDRLRIAALAYTLFGALELVAVARYTDAVRWEDAVAWVWLGVAAAVALTGAAGVALARRKEVAP